jgi:predicted aspartyl protease
LRFSVRRRPDQAIVALEGIIDTGFDGFVQIPLMVGAVMGFVTGALVTTPVGYADGTVRQVPIHAVQVSVEGESKVGIGHFPQEPGSPILIGMGFLRSFERGLLISDNLGVLLPSEPALASIAPPTPSLPPPTG